MKSKGIAVPYVIWMAIFVVAPLLIIVFYAFTSQAGGFTLENFSTMAQYTGVFGRSFLLAIIATFICLLIGYPLSYWLAQESPAVRRVAMMLIMLPMWMNFLLRTYSWMFLLEKRGLINSFLGLFGIGPFQMINTQGAVVLGMVYNFLPFMILPILSVLEKIDPKVIEAAQDLGANSFTVFRRVTFPLSLPGVLSGVTMVFIPSVSTFVISRLLGGKDETDCAEAVERFLKSIDLNCKLRELGVEESGIDWMTDNCINVFAGSMRNHTKALTRDEVKQIYLEAF